MATKANARKPAALASSQGGRHGSRGKASTKANRRTQRVPHHAAGVRGTDEVVAVARAAGSRQHRDGLATTGRQPSVLQARLGSVPARPAAVLTSDIVEDIRLAARRLLDACEAASQLGLHRFLADTVVTVTDETARAITISRNELARLIGRESAAVSLGRWSKQETPVTDCGGKERQRSRVDRKPQASHG